MEKAIEATLREDCQALVDDLTQSNQELDALSQDLSARLGQYAPAFTGLRQALDECRTLAEQILQRKGPGESPVVSGSGPARRVDLDDKWAALVRRRAGHLARSGVSAIVGSGRAAPAAGAAEPHPLPHQPRRRAGIPAFPDLIKQLIRNDDVLSEMNRELGIKEPAK